MKILRLTAENIKRLTAVEIEPDGNLVEITGRNGQGKSSVLDSIWWALAGTRSHQQRPIRDGQTKARIELDMGELVVTRGFSEAPGGRVTTALSVEAVDGETRKRLRSPQKVLDALLDAIAFDPLAFVRMSPADQHRALTEVCGVDLDAHEKAQRADYDERRRVNREHKRLSAEARSVVVGEITDRVDVDAIEAELRAARESNAAISDAQSAVRRQERRIERSERDLNLHDVQIRDTEREIERLKTALGRHVEARKSVEAVIESEKVALSEKLAGLAELGPWTDTTEIAARIRTASESNAAVDRARDATERKESLQERAAEAKRTSDGLTRSMEQREADFRAAMAAAEIPVEGLAVERGLVTLNGLPLDQASQSDKIRTSCAIAMRSGSKLRVMLIRDGSLLDDVSLKLLAKLAEDEDCQVWLERVDSSGAVGFVIEDGSLAVAAA